MSEQQYLSESSFDGFMKQQGVSLVVCTADWCAPCQDLKQNLTVLQQENTDLSIAFIDIEAEKSLAESLAVRSIPYVMVVRDAVVLFAESGALSLGSLRELVQQAQQLDMNEVRDQEQ